VTVSSFLPQETKKAATKRRGERWNVDTKRRGGGIQALLQQKLSEHRVFAVTELFSRRQGLSKDFKQEFRDHWHTFKKSTIAMNSPLGFKKGRQSENKQILPKKFNLISV